MEICKQAIATHGGMGYAKEYHVERLFREIRPFRIYDGPSEVHRWAIAKRLMKSAVGKNIPM